MSFYEELLTLGQHLHERERLALYNFLLKEKNDVYVSNALLLLKYKELRSEIANGEILYKLDSDVVSNSLSLVFILLIRPTNRPLPFEKYRRSK